MTSGPRGPAVTGWDSIFWIAAPIASRLPLDTPVQYTVGLKETEQRMR
jgi:hypothetical protein